MEGGDSSVDNSRHTWLEKDSFDVVVLGTGFVESVLAGALSRVGKSVLHLDKNQYYGSNCSSFSLNQLNDMLEKAANGDKSMFTFAKVYRLPTPAPTAVESATTTEQVTEQVVPPKTEFSVIPTEVSQDSTVPEIAATATAEITTTQPSTDTPIQSSDDTTTTTQQAVQPEQPPVVASKKKEVDRSLFGVGRQFIIDLLPSLLYSKGALVQLLISSATSKYLDFKCLDQNYMYINNTLQSIPSTKGSIFKDSTFTLKDKRTIMKFIDSVKALTEEGVDQVQRIEELSKQHGGSFLQFVKSFNMSAQVESFILYGISSVHPSNIGDVSLSDGIKSVLLYISSLLVYGQLPFLIPYYGYGDIPQAFCRLCAVFGGIYVLDRTVKQLTVDSEQNQYTGIICSEGQPIKSTYFVTSPKYLSNYITADIKQEFKTTEYSRCVCITNKRILNSDDCSYITIPPNSIAGNKNTINVYQMESLCSASGYILIHFTTIKSGANAEDDLKAVVETFTQTTPSTEDSSLPVVQWSGYFNMSLDQVTGTYGSYGSALPKNVMLTSDSPISVSIDYELQINEAKALFEKICPGQIFLERVPDSEDIVWGHDEEEQQQSTTTTSAPTTTTTDTPTFDPETFSETVGANITSADTTSPETVDANQQKDPEQTSTKTLSTDISTDSTPINIDNTPNADNQ